MGPAGQAARRAALGGGRRPPPTPRPAGRGGPAGPFSAEACLLHAHAPAFCSPAPPRDPMQGRKSAPTAAGRRPEGGAGERSSPAAVRSTAGPAAAACPLHKPANFPLSGAVSLAPPVPICYNRSNRPPCGGKIRLEVRLWACSIKDPPAPSAAER